MTLEQYANLFEIFGGAIVIVTLIFLLIQLRQNTHQNYQQTFFQIRAGTYDEDLYDGWWQVLRDNFMSPGFELHWKQRKFILSRAFQEFVEKEVLCRPPTSNYAKSLSKKGPA